MLVQRAFFQVGLLSCSLLALASCRGDADGDADTTSDTTSTANTGGGSSTGGGSGTSTGGSGTGGGTVVGCEGPAHTISEITTGMVGTGVKVSVNGVVAMSHKFLAAKSSSDSCLWGVYVSAPGLTETAENSGILVLSYGTNAVIPVGGTTAYCPKLGQEPAGDKIPDDVVPGDVLDVVGTTARFPTTLSCDPPDPPTTVGMLQLGQACSVTKTGTATPPTPHVISGADIAKIYSPTDQAFHDKWGGVKIRIEDVTTEPVAGEVVGMYGVVKLVESPSIPNGLQFGDKIYYRAYSNNICHEGPVYTASTPNFPDVVFNHVQGFHYLNYCTWDIQPNDKCADLDPKSEDCGGNTTCVPDL